MHVTHVDRRRDENSTSLKVTSKGKSHSNGSVSPADLPRKKRVPGACDLCKKRRIRCDSGEMPDNKCTNCIELGYECTHRELTKRLGPARGYVENLEQKLEKMEKLLNKVLPGVDLNQDIDVPPMNLPRNDLLDTVPLMQQFTKLQINPPQNRFFGRSSTSYLVQTALDIKGAYTGSPVAITKRLLSSRRPGIWGGPSRFRTKSLEGPAPPPFTFPEPDLLKALVDLYFTKINPFFPLLHRPTFETSVAEDLHLKDREFGAVVLLACALGAKFSDDSRVFSDISVLEEEDMSDEEKTHALSGSCGWKWFEQVDLMRANLMKRPTLYELQAHALSVLFGQSSEALHGAWTQMGIAMRMAQDVGAHKKRTTYESRAQDELWKRAFWVIACQDRSMSAFSGKPLWHQTEDIDVEFPAECDDEYWDHVDPNQRFQQPVDKPSTMAFFTCYLNLMDILAWAMKAIYSTSKPHLYRFTSNMYSERRSLSDLDSAMNSWMGTLPEHLRWSANQDNLIFLAQSATLHAVYYQLQIFIHRPFIPSPRNPTPSLYPSLAICTNAARSCCYVLEAHSERNPPPFFHILAPTFTAAIVLLLNIWSGKRSGVNVYPRREYEDVQKCLEMWKGCEARWPMAGRLREILTELSSVGDIGHGFDAQSSTTSLCLIKASKRESKSQENSPLSTCVSQGSSLSQAVNTPDLSVPSPGSAPPSESHQLAPSPTAETNAQQQPNFALPFYSNELGSLPIFGQFGFSDPSPSGRPVNQLAFLQRFPPGAPGSSQFVANDDGGLSSSSNAPAPVVSSTPTPATTASSLAVPITPLPIGSLPHPISNSNTQTASGGNPFTTYDNPRGLFSFDDIYSSQGSTQVPSAGGAFVTAQLTAQFTDLGNVNNSGAGGVSLGAIPDLAGGMGLEDIPNLGLNPNIGGPSGKNSGKDVSAPTTQLQRDLLYGTNEMMMDEDMLTMWSTAPSGFDLDDWGTYITSVDQIMRDETPGNI